MLSLCPREKPQDELYWINQWRLLQSLTTEFTENKLILSFSQNPHSKTHEIVVEFPQNPAYRLCLGSQRDYQIVQLVDTWLTTFKELRITFITCFLTWLLKLICKTRYTHVVSTKSFSVKNQLSSTWANEGFTAPKRGCFWKQNLVHSTHKYYNQVYL